MCIFMILKKSFLFIYYKQYMFIYEKSEKYKNNMNIISWYMYL